MTYMAKRLEHLERAGHVVEVEELFGPGGAVVEQYLVDGKTGKELASTARPAEMIPRAATLLHQTTHDEYALKMIDDEQST